MCAEKTAIEWTDATVNFWWGCTKVGPGCDHCYAETWSKRTGHSVWGQGTPRRKIKGAVKLLHRLDNDYSWWAADLVIGAGQPFRPRNVFIQSMSDLFDNEVLLEWFEEAWRTICACNRLNIQIVTKRLPIVEKRLIAIGASWPQHAGLIATVVDQDEAERDVPRLLALKSKLGIPWIGLSMEPLLGPVVLRDEWLSVLNWVIVGGESGPHARPMHPDWARSLRDQCMAAGVPFLFKQWGEWLPYDQFPDDRDSDAALYHPAPDEYPDDSRRCKYDSLCLAGDGTIHPMGKAGGFHVSHSGAFSHPRSMTMFRIGKSRAGRLLDGVEWSQFPEVKHG